MMLPRVDCLDEYAINHAFLIRRVAPSGANRKKQLPPRRKYIMNALKRYSRTILCSIGFLAVALVAGCGGGGDQGRDPILGLPAADLVSVAVTPATASVNIGSTQQYLAIATYTDGSSRDVTTGATWSSATPAVAIVNAATGLATGVTAGTSNIAAAFSGKSGSATLTVNPATLQTMFLLPANASIVAGTTQQYVAMGTFSNNTTRDITALTTFSSATPAVAGIDATTGLATGVAVGTTVITGKSGAISATTNLTVTAVPATLLSIAVTPQAPTLQVGASRALVVTATYSDNSTAIVTSASTYASAAPAFAKVAGFGVVSGVAVGTSTVTASYKGKNANTTVNVVAATLSSIAVVPATATIGVNTSQQFDAIATYADNSTGNITSTSVWTSSNTAVATVLPSGVANGLMAGITTITATSGGKSANAVLTVTAAQPLPPSAPVALGRAARFAVLAGTALTNNSGGTTLIGGDVGSPSQTTDPTVKPGFANYKSGAILDGGLADLQLAITDANGRTCDVNSAAGIDLGGATLTPGVYCYAGSINITGTLTLSGPGVYIFRTASTLDTTSGAIVQLLGGATADNVTWVPVGPTTLAANSVFKGSILGKSAAITVGDTTTILNGRVLSGAAVTLKNNQIDK
jgi:uncharacterized protein YjdB